MDEVEIRKVVANAVKNGWARYPANHGAPSLIDALPDDEDEAPVPTDTPPPVPPEAA